MKCDTVMNRASVALSAQPRAPSSEYWTPFPISPVPRSNHRHRCSSFTSPYKQPSDSLSVRSLVLPRRHFWAFLYWLSGLHVYRPVTVLGLWFSVCCLPRPLPVSSGLRLLPPVLTSAWYCLCSGLPALYCMPIVDFCLSDYS